MKLMTVKRFWERSNPKDVFQLSSSTQNPLLAFNHLPMAYYESIKLLIQ